MSGPVLSVEDLSVTFSGATGPLYPVDTVSFSLSEGEVLGIVGESGSGKSVTCLAVAGLLGPTAQASGVVRYDGRALDAKSLRDLPRKQLPSIGMIFQEPANCLNPVRTIGSQIVEAAMVAGMSRRAATQEARNLLEQVSIAPERFNAYPSQFSGGMSQRVMIAMALATQPRLLIADEPTTALDVTVQAQVVQLLLKLVRQRGIPMIFISHDLDLVAEVCDRIAVMYGGALLEINTTEEIYERPRHPYTRLLLDAMPGRGEPLSVLADIPGELRANTSPLSACAFAERCPRVVPRCREQKPVTNGSAQTFACFNPWSA